MKRRGRWLEDGEQVFLTVALATVLLWLLLRALAFFCAQMTDHALTPDWAWLYRAGLYLLEARRLPATDLFSWTHPDREWVLYQWLFEAGSAAAYQWLGRAGAVAGLSLLAIALYVLVPAWHARRRGVPVLLTAVLGSLVLVPVGVNFGLRPMAVTTAGLLVQYLLVTRWREGGLGTPALAACLAGLYVVWANAHLGVVLGLLSLGLFALGDARQRHPAPRAYAAPALAAFGATLVNPYGPGIYVYLAGLSLKTPMNRQISELAPPDMGSAPFVLAGALLILFLLDLLRGRRGYAGHEILHLLVFAALAALSLRMVVWAGLFYVLVVPAGLWRAVQAYPHHLAGIRAALAMLARADRVLLPALALAALALATWVVPLERPVRIAHCDDLRPAIRYLDTTYPRDIRWFSDEVAGSCALLHAPDRPVFGDTRFDFYPQDFVLDWFAAIKGRDGWRAFLDDWDVAVVLVSTRRPLAAALRADSGYVVVHEDRHAVVLERRPVAGP